MTVYFDLDGSIADLYSVENWLPKLRASDPSPFLDAAPLCDMSELLLKLNQLQALGFRVGVISWCSKEATKEYNSAVRKAKREWLKTQLPGFKFDEVHIVPYGTPKSYVAKDSGWLIDDEARNREVWNRKNPGYAYDPTTEDIMAILDSIMSEV